jgi:hypothetical protein
MKKLLTIIFALSLVMAVSMPAAAIDDIDPAVAVNANDVQQATDQADLNTGTQVDADAVATGGSTAQDAQYAASDSLNGSGNDMSNNSDNSTTLTDSQNTDASMDNDNYTATWTDQSQDNDTYTATANDSFKTEDNDTYNATLTDQSQDNDTYNATLTDNSQDNSDQGNIDVAVDDINVSDVANDKSYDDNDLLDNKGGKIEVSDIANDKSQDNDDSSTNDSYNDNSQDNDDSSINTDVAVHDINVSDVANDKSDDDLLDVEGDINVSDIANDKSQDNDDNSTNDSNNTDNSINTDNSTDDDVAVAVAFDDVVDMEGNQAAAALGGFAIGINIDDIELDFATTTSTSVINQSQAGWSNMSADADADRGGNDAEAIAGFLSECHSVDADVYQNIGIMGATFSAGHFNNQANLNSLNVTVQY